MLAPAERAIFGAAAGTQLDVHQVPAGMLRSGRLLPTLDVGVGTGLHDVAFA